MNRSPIWLACLFISGLCLAQDNPLQTLIETHAPAIVTVKAVQSIAITVPGAGAQEEEEKIEMRGVVVDAGGLVMVSDSGLNNSALKRMLNDPRFSVDITTDDIFVIFENEEKEYTARLVATDSELDLAFLQIDALEGRELSAVDFAGGGGQLAIGTEVYGVTRHGRSFDFAPYFTRALVNGKVKKPRKLWNLSGELETGLPLFDAAGALVGVGIVVLPDAEESGGLMARLQTAGGGAVMLLPGNKVQTLVSRALEQAASLDEQGTSEP